LTFPPSMNTGHKNECEVQRRNYKRADISKLININFECSEGV